MAERDTETIRAAQAELTRALALTIAYKAAVDDEARGLVVAEIRSAIEFARPIIAAALSVLTGKDHDEPLWLLDERDRLVGRLQAAEQEAQDAVCEIGEYSEGLAPNDLIGAVQWLIGEETRTRIALQAAEQEAQERFEQWQQDVARMGAEVNSRVVALEHDRDEAVEHGQNFVDGIGMEREMRKDAEARVVALDTALRELTERASQAREQLQYLGGNLDFISAFIEAIHAARAALSVSPAPTPNRAQRRAEKHGNGVASQLDHGPRQGG